MRAQSMVKWFVALAALAYAPSQADAQNGGSPPPAPTSISFSGNVGMTPQQEIAAGSGYVSTASTASQSVAQKLADARKQGDVVKTLCLNDVLSQINAAQRTMSERLGQLTNAGADTDLANHEYTILSVLSQRIAQLQTEASNCIGTSDTSQNASVIFTVDPNIAPGDATPPWWSEPVPPPPINVLPVGFTPPQSCSPAK